MALYLVALDQPAIVCLERVAVLEPVQLADGWVSVDDAADLADDAAADSGEVVVLRSDVCAQLFLLVLDFRYVCKYNARFRNITTLYSILLI